LKKLSCFFFFSVFSCLPNFHGEKRIPIHLHWI
jgi:hypothetical protein